MNLSQFSYFKFEGKPYRQYMLYILLVSIVFILFTCGEGDSVAPEKEPEKKVTITFNQNYIGAFDEKKLTINQGSTVSIANPVRKDYKFLGWSQTVAGETMVSLGIDTFNQDTILYAKWEKNTYTVSFDLNYPDAVNTPPVQEILSGENVKKPTTTYIRAGYKFVNWYDNREGLGIDFQFNSEIISGDKVLYAKWTALSYNVAFRLNYTTSELPPLEQTVSSNNKAREPSPPPTRNNYKFEGWYEDASGNGDAFVFASTTIDSNKTLYAKWSKSIFKIEFNLNYTGATNTPPLQMIPKDEKATAPDTPTRLHYTFSNWYDNNQSKEPYFDFNTKIIEDITLYADWTRNKFNVSFNLQYEDAVNTPPVQEILSGENAIKPSDMPERASYSFVGWYTNANGNGNIFDFDNTTITANTVLYAIWSKNFVISFNSLGGTSINPQSIPEGGKAEVPTIIPLKAHYLFDAWYPNEQVTGASYDFANTIITGSRTLYAKWNPIVFKVTFNLNYLNPTKSIPEQDINSGGMAMEPKDNPERTFFDFVNWFETENPVVDEVAYDFTSEVLKNKTLYARWKIKKHTVEFSLNYTGAPTIMPQEINSGLLATKPPSQMRSGYTFGGWYENQNPTTEDNAFNFTTIIRKNTFLYAKWDREKYNVAFDPNYLNENGDSAPIYSQGLVTGGSLASPPAIPPKRKGYDFVNWYVNKNGDEPSFDFANTTITQMITLYAKWTEGKRVDFNSNGGNIVSSQLISQGDLVEAPDNPRRNHYEFLHWYYTENGSDIIFDFLTKIIDKDITLYAKWKNIKYTVTFDLNYTNPTQSAPPVQTINSGDKVMKPTKMYPRTHFEFLYWFEDINGIEVLFDFSNTIVDRNITLYAKWKRNTYLVTFNKNHTDATGTDTFQQSVLAEQHVSVPQIPLRDYHTFQGWYTESTPNQGTAPFAFDTTPILKNLELYAQWTRNIHKVSFNLNYTGATGTPPEQDVLGGDLVKIPPTPSRASNFFFVGWFTSNDIKYNFDAPVDNTFTLTAKWSDIGFLVLFDTDTSNGGTLMDSQRVAKNTFATNPGDGVKLGYYFEGWYTTTTRDVKFQFDTTPITEDTTIYAKFKVTLTPANKDELINLIDQGIATIGDNGDFNYIDTRLIDNFDNLFARKPGFNGDISKWNVSNVKSMISTFAFALSFNGNLNDWNVEKVENMISMFAYARSFNKPLDKWNVAMVTNMSNMFNNANAFNQNISSWNVQNVNNMGGTFSNAASFNQPLDSWDVSNVVHLTDMFNNSIYNKPLNNWNVSKVKFMVRLFSNNVVFNQPLSNWNVSLVSNMTECFSGAKAFDQDINSWNVSAVFNMTSMFENAQAFNHPLNNWNVHKVTIMFGMFNSAFSFNQDISSWNVSNVVDLSRMFENANSFNQNLANWDIQNTDKTTNTFLNSGMEDSKPAWAN